MERGFIGLDIAVLAVSDAATVAEDVPARIVIEKLESAGHRITARERIDDSLQLIKAKYLEWIADSQIDVIIVTSGAKSESASEALAPLVTKPLSGFADLFRYLSFSEIGTAAMLVDAAAGQCKSTFVFVLPASVGAVRTALDKLLLPQLDYRTKPTNLVMRMPRHHHGAPATDDAPVAKTPWIVASPTSPVTAPPRPAKPRAGTEPGTPAAIAHATSASVSQRIAVAAIARPEPVSVSQRMSAVLEAAAPAVSAPVVPAVPAVTSPPPDAFATKESTEPGVPPPPPPPIRTKVTTAKDIVPLKPPAQIIPLSKLLTNAPDAIKPDEPVEELPAAELKDIAPAQIVDDEPDDNDSDEAPPPPPEDLPIPAVLSTKIPTGPIRIEDEETREAILAAQKRAVTERVTPIDELPPRSVAIPARRKRDPKVIAIWSVIVLAAASLVVMFFIARERDRRAQALREQQQREADRVADLSPPAPTPLEPVGEPAAIPDAGAVEPDESDVPRAPEEPDEPEEPEEIDMSGDVAPIAPDSAPPTTHAANQTRPTRPTTTPQPRPPRETAPPIEKPVPAIEKPEPEAPAVEPGCDEVSCVLDRYRLSCCAKFKPREPATPPVRSGVPAKLDKAMVTSGIAKVKPVVIRCGETHGVKGQVKISVTVSPSGDVTSATVAASPDDALGACVANAVKKASFATTETGGSFTYPFVF